MNIERFALNALGTNTYVVSDRDGETIVIDPSAPDMSPVVDYIEANGLRTRAIVNTHCHFDHVLGNDVLRAQTGAPLWLHRAEDPVLRDAPKRAQDYLGVAISASTADRYLQAGDIVAVGALAFVVLETPGHSPGGICLYERQQGVVFCGDTLFAGTVGRTDLPGADASVLRSSLREQLWPLPDETVIYPGHGDESTIGDERMHNPYFHFPAAQGNPGRRG
jgi:hydroxyacylglutathione hydrolase